MPNDFGEQIGPVPVPQIKAVVAERTQIADVPVPQFEGPLQHAFFRT